MNFTCLPFRPITLRHPLRTTFQCASRCKDQDLTLFSERVCGTCQGSKGQLQGATFGRLSSRGFAVRPFNFTRDVCARSICLLFSLVGVSDTTIVSKTYAMKTSESEQDPTSHATYTMMRPGMPVLVSF